MIDSTHTSKKYASQASLAWGRVTRDDVAMRAGVSAATVSYVVNNGPRPVAPATRERVLQAIRDLGYTPDAVARSLRTRHTGLLGLIVPDSANLFFAELARQIELAAEERGYHILLCNSGEDASREHAHLEALRQQRVDGLLLIPTDTVESSHVSTEHDIPIVVLDRSPLISAQRVICTSPEVGSALAVKHLVTLDHRHIGFAHGPLRLSHARRRLEGGIAALHHYGLQSLPEWLIECSFDFAGGWQAAQRFLAQSSHPTAICCGNDAIAVGLLAGLHAAGVAVPEAISVVGFDDIPLARYAIPPLTTIAQPYAAMAQRALDALLNSARIPSSENAPEVKEVLPVTLVQRRSTASPLHL